MLFAVYSFCKVGGDIKISKICAEVENSDFFKGDRVVTTVGWATGRLIEVLCQKQLFRYIIRSYDTYAYRKGKFSEQSKRGSIVFNLGSWWRFTYNEVFSVDWVLRKHHFGLLADKLKREPHKLFYPDLFTMNLLNSIDIIPFDVFKHLFRIYGDSIVCDHFYNPLVQNAFLFGRKDIVEHIQRAYRPSYLESQ
ncbi:hypothetical protein PPL_01850 [Heterostelium album PN500]|uniref:Uncharacterized protein n=1 Tax=Heterostelium pallidum (strain ATCC 26659 / Pp 5 / PN500) TaxID=670386 RepID=D3B0N3_HETP5|nr:hypothetical protein PPL_01850 [Heterostelium album PN500]EFA84857.1 hypothetical protein PPL_01850 [Heterostelium album PN500]|eukprot:XP_020436968.1 hypothetical protein PPL_01850 [Heterostelium album PN500]